MRGHCLPLRCAYNWRCANRGSVPKDLIDDMYHVLNAVYCDVYASAEAGQAEYAHLLLTPATRVAIYDKLLPVDEWMVNLVSGDLVQRVG
jgi:hypothetical protein